MLDKLFRVHSENNGAAMNGTASTKEGPPNGVRRALSERPTPDMLRRTDSMTAFQILYVLRTSVWRRREGEAATPRTRGALKLESRSRRVLRGCPPNTI